MTKNKEIWRKVCKRLEAILQPDVYQRWIAVIEPGELTDGHLHLKVDNDFYQSWLEEHYLPLIRQAILTETGEELKISFKISPREQAPTHPADTGGAAAETVTPKASRAKRSPGQANVAYPSLNPNFSFDQFIVGPTNSFSHAAALAVAQAPAKAYNPLFIYGGVGLGKTHLMVAIGHHLNAAHTGPSAPKICYISSEQFLNEYINALQNRSLAAFRRKYRHTDLLLIDDIHFLASKERLQEEFFHTFNALFDAHKQIVMTSDRPAGAITGLEQRLVSRFEWGLVTELEPPDLETRIAILRQKQRNAAKPLADELLAFIAENVRSNIRRLEGALVRAVSYASLTGKELTLDSLKHLLRDTLEQEKRTEVTFADIQRCVAEYYDIRLADMTSTSRQRSVSTPRQIAMYLCRRMTRSSLPDIANAFGKTHATVMHACKAIDNRIDVDSDMRRSVEHLSHKLGASPR